MTTYRRIPWEDNVPFFLVSFFDPEKTEEPLSVCPRMTVERAMKGARERGWECMAGVEYEVRAVELQGLFADSAVVLSIQRIRTYDIREEFYVTNTSNTRQ